MKVSVPLLIPEAIKSPPWPGSCPEPRSPVEINIVDSSHCTAGNGFKIKGGERRGKCALLLALIITLKFFSSFKPKNLNLSLKSKACQEIQEGCVSNKHTAF